MSADQDDIDGMFASFDSALGESDDIAQSLEGGADNSPQGEDTASSANGQEEAGPAQPWVDYVPKVTFEKSEDLPSRIVEYFELLEATMFEKELKLYDYVLKKGDVRYYDDFLNEVGDTFRNIVKLKRRRVNGERVVKNARDISQRYLPGFEPHQEEEEEKDVPQQEKGASQPADEAVQNESEAAETSNSDEIEAGASESVQTQEQPAEGESTDGEQSQEDIDALLESS